MIFTPPTDAAKIAADRIRENADRGYQTERARTELRPEIVRSAIARRHLTAKAAMAEQQSTSATAAETTRRALTRKAFGADDTANNIAAHRDAQDRASRLATPRDAAAMLSRAEDSGDSSLAKAVAQRAFEQHTAPPMPGVPADPGWADVLTSYVSTRPQAADAINTLAATTTRAPAITDLWAFVLPAPPELAGLSDTQIAALAEQQPTDAGLRHTPPAPMPRTEQYYGRAG